MNLKISVRKSKRSKELNKLSFPGKNSSIKLKDNLNTFKENRTAKTIIKTKTIFNQNYWTDDDKNQNNLKLGENADDYKMKNNNIVFENDNNDTNEISENVDEPITILKSRPSESNLNIKLSARLQDFKHLKITEDNYASPNRSHSLKSFETPSKKSWDSPELEFDPDFSYNSQPPSRSTASSGRKTTYVK